MDDDRPMEHGDRRISRFVHLSINGSNSEFLRFGWTRSIPEVRSWHGEREDLPRGDAEGGPGAGPPRPGRRGRDPRDARGPPPPDVRPGDSRGGRGHGLRRLDGPVRPIPAAIPSASVVDPGVVGGAPLALRRAAQPAARDGRGPEQAWAARPPPARPARRAGADLCRPARSRRARGLARRLVRYVAERLEPDEDPGPEDVRDALREAVESCVQIAPPIAAVAGTRRVVALVGPTGRGQDDHRGQARGQLQAGARAPAGAGHGRYLPDRRRRAAADLCRDHRPAAGRGQRPGRDAAGDRRA